ncbi:MAG: HDOD domain-containing protein [Planctomycetota bacterium]|nr:HDOD domain-containing protein [Planctomycetota bacterium]
MADIREVLDNFGDMPILPDVVAKLTQLIASPRTTASDINEILSRDPSLTARILRLVNSSYYGFSRRITTITNAVVILGFNQVRNLALSAFIMDNFSVSKASGFDMKAFWRHSIGTALVAGHIAKGLRVKLEEDAFVCALLHDLGKSVMAMKAPEDMRAVLAVVEAERIVFHEAEKKTLDYDHATIGAALMERWNLPELMVEVARCHHDPESASEETRPLASVVNFADIIARSTLMGSAGDPFIPRLSPEVFERTGLNWPGVEAIMRRSALEYRESDLFFAT